MTTTPTPTTTVADVPASAHTRPPTASARVLALPAQAWHAAPERLSVVERARLERSLVSDMIPSRPHALAHTEAPMHEHR